MIMHTPALHLFVAAITAAAPVDPSTCSASDLRCTGQANLDAARLATSNEQKAKHLYRAHRAYLALADSGPTPQRVHDLCRAQQLLKQARTLKATELHARLATSEAETDAKFKATGIECQPRKRNDRPAPARIATTTSPDAEPPPLLPAGPRTTTSQIAVGPADASPLTSSPVSPLAPENSLLPVLARDTTSTAPPRDRPQEPTRQGRGLMIAGAATLGIGLGLAGAAGYLGGRLLATRRDSQALRDDIDGFATSDQVTTDQALTRDYERLAPATLTLALVGGVSVIVGAVLVGVGGHRLARVASRTAVVPLPGGLAFHARF